MRTLYSIRREDFFKAVAANQIPDDCIIQVGSLWMVVALTHIQRMNFIEKSELKTNPDECGEQLHKITTHLKP
jgi:hypothetical protein